MLIQGSQQCSTNNAARYGTAIGIGKSRLPPTRLDPPPTAPPKLTSFPTVTHPTTAVLFALLFYLCLRQRRRRAHSANLVYAQQQQAELGRRPNQQGSYSYGGGYAGGQGGGQQATAAGYPSQSYGQGQTGMYNASESRWGGPHRSAGARVGSGIERTRRGCASSVAASVGVTSSAVC